MGRVREGWEGRGRDAKEREAIGEVGSGREREGREGSTRVFVQSPASS